jgi:glycerol 3-phosphatase-1
MEGEIPLLFGDDAVEIKGARALLTELDEANMPWAVVTSGTRPLVEGWLKILRLAEPRCLVTAEDVANGKPDPACYLLGRQRLGIRGTEKPLVVEDAPAGIRAGKAAGFDVLALATTHEINELVEAGADCIVRNLESVVLETDIEEPGLLRVSFHNTLQVRD